MTRSKNRLPIFLSLAMLGVILSPLVPTSYGAGMPPGQDDMKFAQEAAMAGMTEVAAGRLALSLSHDSEIQQFGQTIVTDHSEANTKLARIAQTKNLSLPTALDDHHQDMIDTLKSSRKFDEDFSEMMKDDHDKAVALFEKQAKKGKDPDLRAFAQDTVPTLRAHLAAAKRLDSKY